MQIFNVFTAGLPALLQLLRPVAAESIAGAPFKLTCNSHVSNDVSTFTDGGHPSWFQPDQCDGQDSGVIQGDPNGDDGYYLPCAKPVANQPRKCCPNSAVYWTKLAARGQITYYPCTKS